MKPPTNEELGLDENGFPPQDEHGNDLRQIEENLCLTPDERLQQHERFLALVRAVQKAGRKYYGRTSPAHPPAD